MTDFHLLIADWYRQNSRDLPWRNTKDAYFIWLSEIILQQTRVDQGLNYYLKFKKHYPTVNDLANATEQEVLNDWQGLGYYSRARNLHSAAKTIVTEFNGDFPIEYETIRKLKGIGDYTAAAIASFAFDLPHAVVDGNVYRVLSRCFDIDLPIDSNLGKKQFAELAQSLLNTNDAATHNQAIMELGALVCKPTQPLCEKCPLSGTCMALSAKTIQLRPVKSKRTAVRDRYFNFLIFSEKNQVLLEKRMQKDIWQHLHQFPMIESDHLLSLDEITTLIPIKPTVISSEILHLLSHQRIHGQFIHYNQILQIGEITSQSDIITSFENHALPRIIDRYLEEQCAWENGVISPKKHV